MRFLEAKAKKNQSNNTTNSSTHTQHQHLIQPHQRLAVAVDIAIVVRPHTSLWMLAMVPQVELHFFPQFSETAEKFPLGAGAEATTSNVLVSFIVVVLIILLLIVVAAALVSSVVDSCNCRSSKSAAF